MIKLKQFARVPHAIFNCAELSPDGKMMMTYLVVRSNWFNCEECFFSLPLKLLKDDIGFDKNKVIFVRSELKSLGLIDFKRGGGGKATLYKINWDKLDDLTNRFLVKNEELPF